MGGNSRTAEGSHSCEQRVNAEVDAARQAKHSSSSERVGNAEEQGANSAHITGEGDSEHKETAASDSRFHGTGAAHGDTRAAGGSGMAEEQVQRGCGRKRKVRAMVDKAVERFEEFVAAGSMMRTAGGAGAGQGGGGEQQADGRAEELTDSFSQDELSQDRKRVRSGDGSNGRTRGTWRDDDERAGGGAGGGGVGDRAGVG